MINTRSGERRPTQVNWKIKFIIMGHLDWDPDQFIIES